MATISRTTIVLYRSEPDPHVIRLRRLDSISDFLADTRISVASQAALLAGARFRAAAAVSVGATGTRLNVYSALAGTPTIPIGASAFLPLANPLAAQAGIHVEVQAPLTIYPLLRALPTIRVSSAPARLTVGMPLRASPQIQVRSNNPRLSRLAQHFQAQAGIRVGTAGANLRVIGQSATDVFITFNGVATFNVRLNSIAIEDILNEAPNTCRFVIDQRPGQPGPPAVGTDVRIGLRDLAVNNVLFAGTVKTLDPYYEAAPKNPAWEVNCDDYTFLLNRRKVFGTWTKVSATQVALEILAKFTSGFSTAGIAAGLAPVTVTFRGETVMDALTQIANLCGGYAGGPDYNRVVYLFVTDPRPAPDPVTASSPLLMMQPPVKQTLDLSQIRTRVDVQGASTSVGGPSDFTIDNRYGQLPLDDSQIFTPGQGGQVITEDAQILDYTDCVPGKLATIVKGNVPPPSVAPIPTIAPNVAGELVGQYRWKVAFANENGETEVGPATFPPLTCAAFPTPTATMGIGLSSAAIGPLVGKYDYAVTFVTSKGETLPSARVTRTASAIARPTSLTVQNGGTGRLTVGASYGYQVSYMTRYGETDPFGPTIYTPEPLAPITLSNFQQLDFGGLQGNADYSYGVSFVTAIGESFPPATVSLHTFSNAGGPGSLSFTGFSDFNGRIGAGNYAWGISYYNDQFGETAITVQIFNNVNPPPPGSQGVRVGIGLPGLSARADGLRLYRGFQGNNPWALVTEFRRPNVGSNSFTYLDFIAQTECGNPWPVSQLRGGGIAVQFLLGPVSADVVARRIYRTKANSPGELYLIAELQTRTVGLGAVTYLDAAFDTALSARGPVVQSTGRAAIVTLPGLPTFPSPTGFTGRRVYRTKGNVSGAYYRLADIKDMTTPTLLDDTPDQSLTAEGPVAISTAGGESHQLLNIPLGPTGTLARRIYRTIGNGVELRLLVELQNNTAQTFLDDVPDANLGNNLAPLVAKAGASAVLLSNVPLGGPSITKRYIYRTKAIAPDGQGGDHFFYVGALDSTPDPEHPDPTQFIDTKADDDLGRPPVATSTIGALAGDTALVVASAAGWPNAGWFEADSQVIRYAGITYSGNPALGDTLLNIPPLQRVLSILRAGQTANATTDGPHGFTVKQRVVVLGADQPEYNGTRTITAVPTPTTFNYVVSGAPASPATWPAGQKLQCSAPGAITGAIAGGTTVLSVPMLVGVSGIVTPLDVGSSVNLWVVRNSVAGQQALAALEGGDGVREYVVTDSDLKSIADCAARGDAELLAFQYVGVTINYTTRDRKTRSGPLVAITLPAPLAPGAGGALAGISGSFRIQSVRIDQIDIAARLYPRYAVTCGSTKFSITDLLRHVVLDGAA